MRRKPIPKETQTALLKRANYQCEKCYRSECLQMHHIKKVSQGGDDSLENLYLLCEHCHDEWHVIENNSRFSFEEWLMLPNITSLICLYRELRDNPVDMKKQDIINLITTVQYSTVKGVPPGLYIDPLEEEKQKEVS